MPTRRTSSSRETKSKPSFTVAPPQDGKCSKCRGLMEMAEVIKEGDFHRFNWKCINCGRNEYQQICSRRAVIPQKPDNSLQDNETLRWLVDDIRHFRRVAKAKEVELEGVHKAQEKKRLRKQQLVLRAMVGVLQTIQELYSPAFADAVMDADPENPITPLYSTYELLMLRAEKHGLGGDEHIQTWFYVRKKLEIKPPSAEHDEVFRKMFRLLTRNLARWSSISKSSAGDLCRAGRLRSSWQSEDYCTMVNR